MRVVEIVHSKGFDRGFHVSAAKAEAKCRVEAVHDVGVMGPTLGPVLPGMHRGIGADVPIGPVWWRALLVIPLERGGVILALVAKKLTEFLVPGGAGNETVPIVVADFVAEM